MSKECIDKCPRIKALTKKLSDESVVVAFSMFNTDLSNKNSVLSQLLQAIKDSYDCKGPGTCKEAVKKGVFKKITVFEDRSTCGLDQKIK